MLIGVFITLVGALIAHAAWVIHRDTFEVQPGGTRDATCEAGLHRLHDLFEDSFARRRRGEAAAFPPGAERDLLALRPACEREGPEALEAYEALLRWRFRGEDQMRVWSRTLSDDAARALHYHSPGTPR